MGADEVKGIHDRLNQLDERLHDVEKLVWKVVGGIMGISTVVSSTIATVSFVKGR